MDTIPWVEKYRPKTFDDIVLSEHNKRLLQNIITTNNIPNLLFYGPPGTGKTTTIINMINAYKEQNNIRNNDIIMHLNASDERGIETLRSNILQFVSSTALFRSTLKFVILDEVDYMTKNAQQALKYILATYSKNIRFILICNYISKIDKSVQDNLIKLQFNKLPSTNIIHFLKKICLNENIAIKKDKLMNIQQLFQSDIRSMINYLQCNKSDIIRNKLFLKDSHIKELIQHIIDDQQHDEFEEKIFNISKKLNIDRREIIKKVLVYSLREYPEYFNTQTDIIDIIAYGIHNYTSNVDTLLRFIFYNLRGFFNKSTST